MVDVFLGPVIEKLIEEVKSLKEVHGDGEVESLKEELEIIQPLLRDAEVKSEKGETSDSMKAWMNQIKVQADRIEDLVDNHRYHVTELQHEKGFRSYVRKTGEFFKYLKPRRKIASDIQSIKKSLREIKGRGKGYGLRPLDQPGSSRGKEHVDPRLESLFVEDEEIVGISSVKDDLTGKLVKGPSGILVISLVGQGGVGKTTLAKKVYDDVAVVERFGQARAWITVSQPYDLKKILKTLAEKLFVGREAETIEVLIECVRTFLRTKRYVIVFDDVWEERFWDDIKLALPINNEGSRILVTTRNGLISDHCKMSPYDQTLHMKPWSGTQALDLFCKKAFRFESRGACPKELLELSIEIVSKCQGLPLVIAAIAGILATKEKTVFEWKRVLYDLNSKVGMSSELNRVRKILSLSYHDLPCSLRPCFTYMCLFPEDYSIPDERLYRLWIAEGFVRAVEDKTLEEVAETYLSELLRRNMVLFDQYRVVGEGNYYSVHDLMRDIILTRAEKLSSCQIWDAKASKFIGNGRRLMITGDVKNATEKCESSRARSLFLSNIDNDHLTESFMATFFHKFKLLEVLDVESLPINALPKELGKMLCLKYLSLKGTNVKSLPTSISKLQNLYSLDIRETPITELPKEINELQNLQHILAYRYNPRCKTTSDYVAGVRMQEGFRGLEGLQTLAALESRPGGVTLMNELEKLDKLRWLGVVGLNSESGNALCTALGKMKHLQRLCLLSADVTEPLALQHVPSPLLELRDLVLATRLVKIPDWIPELQSLRGLTLTSSRLNGIGSIEPLKDLPSLESLQIGSEAYEGEELHFEEGGFRRLKSLMMYKLKNLRVVKIDKGALLVLEQLQLTKCPLVKEVSSLRHLKNLHFAIANGKLIV